MHRIIPAPEGCLDGAVRRHSKPATLSGTVTPSLVGDASTRLNPPLELSTVPSRTSAVAAAALPIWQNESGAVRTKTAQKSTE
jgi:hypothetical protein